MKYEYCKLNPLLEQKGLTFLDQLNVLGKKGWYFVFKESGTYYFVREAKKRDGKGRFK